MVIESTPRCTVNTFIDSRFPPKPAIKFLDIKVRGHTD